MRSKADYTGALPPRFRWALLLAPLAYALFFHGLTQVGMLSHDEPRYAAIGQNMARTGDFITPRLWDFPWFEKPALTYWLVALGTRLGFPEEAAARAPIAALSLAFCVFVWWWLRPRFGSDEALVTTTILATNAGWIAYSHLAVTDLPLAACFGASMLMLFDWIDEEGDGRWLNWSGVMLGFAILAKGLVPLVLAAPVFWFGRKRPLDLVRWLGIALVVAAPWYLAVTYHNGWRFIEDFFIRHHFSRFVSNELQHAQPVWYYVPVLLGLLMPWAPLLAGVRLLGDPRLQFTAAWLGWGFLFFSASTNKLPGYLLPLLPAAAILLGVAALYAKRMVIPLVVAGALLGLVPVAADVLPGALQVGLTKTPFSMAAIQLGLAVSLAGALLAWFRWRRDGIPAAVLMVGLLTVAAVVWTQRTVYPALDDQVSARRLWRSIEGRRDQICTGNLDREWRYGLNYYAVKPLPDCLVAEKPLTLEQREGTRPQLWTTPAATNRP